MKNFTVFRRELNEGNLVKPKGPEKPEAVKRAEEIKKLAKPDIPKMESPKTSMYRVIRAVKDNFYVPKVHK